MAAIAPGDQVRYPCRLAHSNASKPKLAPAAIIQVRRVPPACSPTVGRGSVNRGTGRVLSTSASAPTLLRQSASSSSSSSSYLRKPQSLLAPGISAGDLRSIGDLTEDDLAELRQLRRPPTVVRRALQTVHFVLSASDGQQPPSKAAWTDVQQMLCSEKLSQVPDERLRELQRRPEFREQLNREFITPKGVEPLTLARVQRASPAAAALLAWSTHESEQAGKPPRDDDEERRVDSEVCVFKCSCGYASGLEHIFQMHMRSVEGSPGHQMIKSCKVSNSTSER